MKSRTAHIQWVLFDLGDVLVDYQPGGVARMARALGIEEAAIGAAFHSDLSSRIYTGRLSPEAFTKLVGRQLGITVSPEDLVGWFSPDVETVFPEIPPLLEALSAGRRLGVLSNTFFVHWEAFLRMPVADFFDCKMASHTLGYLKPDARIYREAMAVIGARPENVLFIDDKEENIEGAQAVGMHAFQSRSPADTLRGLRRIGLITSPEP